MHSNANSLETRTSNFKVVRKLYDSPSNYANVFALMIYFKCGGLSQLEQDP